MQKPVKACVLGASGGIGQPLSLLLKTSPLISKLDLYDVVNTPGVAKDLSHINTPAIVDGYLPENEGLKKTLTGADIVVIPAGIPRKPGMTREDLFNINAGIVAGLAKGIADYCPEAFILVISNPVNSTVPIVAEVLKKNNVFNPKKLFGVTTLDVVRSSTFVAEKIGDPSAAPHVNIPVVGGHSGVTIVPLLSQSNRPLPADLDEAAIKALTDRIQFGGDEVVKAKSGTGSATLSMAYAGAEFAFKILRALAGETGISTPAYVNLDGNVGGKEIQAGLGSEISYFAGPVTIGIDGVQSISIPFSGLSALEREFVKEAVDKLQGNIKEGVDFGKKWEPEPPKSSL